MAFSFCYEFFREERLNKIKQNKENEFMKNFIENLNDITKNINKELSNDKQIKVPGHFQTYYLDCDEVYPPFNHNRTDEEINKLLNWSRNQDYLDFDKIDLKIKFLRITKIVNKLKTEKNMMRNLIGIKKLNVL